MSTKRKPSESAAIASPGNIRRAVIESGKFYPVTDEQLWQTVEDWHQYLEAHRDGDRPWVNGFNDAWESLDYGKNLISRGRKGKMASNVLATFFYYVDMGFYPPPEILATLLDCWEVYRAASGALTLEEAFLGRGIPGGGNFAKRDSSKFRRMVMQWDFVDFLNKGLTRTQAAEAISQMHGGKPDVDSVLRIFRGVTSWKKQDRKEEK